MLGLLSSEHNTEMQNYMREQTNSFESFNIVSTCVRYVRAFLPFLQFPVAFDTFNSLVYTIFEFIDGANFENREILLRQEIIKVANVLLSLDYYIGRDKEETIERNLKMISQVTDLEIWRKDLSQMAHSSDLNKRKTDNWLKDNFIMSLIKNKVLVLLLELVAGSKDNLDS